MAPNGTEWSTINSIRVLAMDAVEKANSGHPGTPMALAPVAYLLWSRFLRHNPANPAWPDRDRFVLSCGHASMLSYALLHLSGYDLSLEDIKSFRQWNSKTPGHPERGHTAGIETTTGPLGQGIGNAVGMALAERLMGDQFNRNGQTIVDHRTWALVSDGDMMEGVASEAASIAGHLGLGKLTLIYDDNDITIDGRAGLSFSENVAGRFEAYGWRILRVNDGNDLAAMDRAMRDASSQSVKPTLIILKTKIGDPAPTKGGTSGAHGAPLGAEEIRKTKEILGWPAEPFHVSEEARQWAAAARKRGAAFEQEWNQRATAWKNSNADLVAQWDRALSGALPDDWESALPRFTPADGQLATRQASAKALNALAAKIPNLIGGSADLAESTGADIKGGGSVSATTTGRNLHWGIREHGMASVLNGIAAHGGFHPFGTTFLIFTDYCKPSIRLSGLMHLPVIYIGTHDSIGLGEDGPTHQPIEQLAMLRATPNVNVIRPADATETAEAWRAAIARTDGPTVLALSRQKLPILDRAALAPAEGVQRGGYILRDSAGTPELIVLATGSEVHIALTAADKLTVAGTKVRVVSMPSWELFEAQPQSYRDQVLPPAVKARISLEAGATMGWHKWVGDQGVTIGIDHFGASAPAERLYAEFGITADAVIAAAAKLRK